MVDVFNDRGNRDIARLVLKINWEKISGLGKPKSQIHEY